jgi:hypothetical protein
MAREIKDLQKLIEERAKAKLLKDLQELSDFIYKHPLLNHYSAPAGSPPDMYIADTLNEKVRRIGAPDIFKMYFNEKYEDSTCYRARLYRFWLPIYIERESTEFLEKVDQVVEDVQNLLDNTQTGR